MNELAIIGIMRLFVEHLDKARKIIKDSSDIDETIRND
jgi:hypothetical protein